MVYFIKLSKHVDLLGYAEEFKVAAANKNGCGEFSHITPVYVVQGMLSIQILNSLFPLVSAFEEKSVVH